MEPVWNHSKYGDLAHYIPDHVQELEFEFECSMPEMCECAELLRSFFHGAELEL